MGNLELLNGNKLWILTETSENSDIKNEWRRQLMYRPQRHSKENLQ